MEWTPGSIITGLLMVVGLSITAVKSLRSTRLRAQGATLPLEAASWSFVGVVVGLGLLLSGTPARGVIAMVVVLAGLLVGLVGIITATIRRVIGHRQAARTGLAAGMIPGPPRAPSYSMNAGRAIVLLFGPIVLPTLLAAQVFEQAYVFVETNYSMLAIVYAFTVATIAAAFLVLWRFLEHRGRKKAHAALEAGMAQRIEDERRDAYRAGFRDGKADAAGYGRGGL